MKKPKFTIGEEVAILTNGRATLYAKVEQIEALYKEIDNEGKFISTKNMIGEMIFKEFEKMGRAKFENDLWVLYDRNFKFREYRYYVRNESGSLIIVKNNRIRNKVKYEAEEVAKRLMRAK